MLREAKWTLRAHRSLLCRSLWHGTVLRELRPWVLLALSRRTVFQPSNNNKRNIPEQLLAIRLSISKEKTNFETIQTVSVMKNGSPSSLLRTFSLILAFTVASNALSHIAGGTTAGLIYGLPLKEALNYSTEGLGAFFLMGGTLSAASTAAYDVANGINPLNGRAL